MGSPPKPWERAGSTPAATLATSSVPSLPSTSTPATTSATVASSSTIPTPPDRPASFTSPAAPLSTALTQQNAFGSPYSSYGSPYGTSYGGFGAGYSPYGGTYGSTYGGFGSYGGMGGMYGGFGNGFPGPYNGALAPSLTAGTQQGFALLHAVVQTVSGVAQMLESTFMATHASFTALVGVAEHFAHLRDALGSVLGLFGLLNWIRDTLRGRRANGPLQREFRQFASGQPPPPPPASKKPLLFFLAAALGVPWALSRLVRLLAERAAPQGALPPLAPSDLTFARAIHAFDPQSPSELALQPDTLVAITGRLDPRTGAEVDPRVPLVGEDGKEIEVEWWKGRTRDGREGWFPRRWVQILERRDPAKPAPVGGAVPPLSTDGEVKKVD